MQFNCRISKKDYEEALRLRRKNLRRVVYAVLICDVLLWLYWMMLAVKGEITKASAVMSQAMIFLIWPVVYLVFLWLFGFYSYRKNRNIKSEFIYRISGEEFSYQSSSGGSGVAPWTSLSYWRESKSVFILVFPSGVFLICPKSCLVAEQQDEFREIVQRVLTKK